MEKECQGVKNMNLDFQFHMRYKKSEVLIYLQGRIAFEYLLWEDAVTRSETGIFSSTANHGILEALIGSYFTS